MINRPSRRRRAAHRGQQLLIFALSSAVVFVIIGIGVDAGFGWARAATEERAAAAAALAGVTYMPDGYLDASGNPGPAQTVAIATAAKNGFTAGGVHNVSIQVKKVCDSAGLNCKNNQLQVVITERDSTYFLQLLGFGNYTVGRKATAEYLRPITLGQPGNQLGADLSTNVGGLNDPSTSTRGYYLMRLEAWGSNRSEGDPFTPNPCDNIGLGGPVTQWATGAAGDCGGNIPNGSEPAGTMADTHALSPTQQTEAANPSYLANALPGRGGENYLIYVGPNETGTAQVYNAGFAPDCYPNPNTCPGSTSQITYHENDSWRNSGNNHTSTDYPVMAYTLYKVPNIFQHSQDTPNSTVFVKSIDDIDNCPSGGNCAPLGYTDLATGGTHSGMPTWWHAWQNIANPAADPTVSCQGTCNVALTGGANGTYYRLRVDTLNSASKDPGSDGSGSVAHKGYAVRVVGPDGLTSANCTDCTAGALNDMTFFTPTYSPSSTTTFKIPIMSIPPEYAGRPINLYVFDPGDLSCNSGCGNTLKVLDPSGNVADTVGGTGAGQGIANLGPSQSGPSCNLVAGGAASASLGTIGAAAPGGSCPYLPGAGNKYNGTWLQFAIQVPSTYNPTSCASVNCASYYWSLQYTVTNAVAGDTLSVAVGFGGTPVHQIPNP